MMKTLVALACLTAVVAACDDAPNAKPKAPTAPEAVVTPAQALVAAPAHNTRSGVCVSYLRERTQLVVRLTRAPKDTALVKRAKALTSIITDACN